MTLFAKSENTQAYLKMGLMGLAGSGKTYTASKVAIGLIEYLRERKLPEGNRPVYFADTETGSSYVKPHFDRAGVELFTAKTRAFSDLVALVNEAEGNSGILLIDSITHFWREFTESYAKKKNRTRLEFQDWSFLKTEWGKFTDRFVNSNLHIIMCGRMGYEYDFFKDEETGKKQLEKTAVKMKAETETGYEPSLLVWMERYMDMASKEVCREAHVLKERFDVIDGRSFKDPTFETFLPHIELLSLGGIQVGVDSSRTSDSIIPGIEGKPEWQVRREQKEIALDEIIEVIKKHHGGRSESEQTAKGDLLEKHFGSRSWKKIETFDFDKIKEGRNALWIQLEGVPYGFVPPSELDVQQEAGLRAMEGKTNENPGCRST